MNKEQGMASAVVVMTLLATGAFFSDEITDAVSPLFVADKKLELETKGDYYEVNWTKYYLQANRKNLLRKIFTYCSEDNPNTCIRFSNPTYAFYENDLGQKQKLFDSVLVKPTRSKTRIFWRGIFPNQTIIYEIKDNEVKETVRIRSLPRPDPRLGKDINYGYCYFIDFPPDMRILAIQDEWNPITNQQIKSSISLSFVYNQSLFFLSPPDLNGRGGTYTFTSDSTRRAENCVTFPVRGERFPFIIDPSVEEPDISAFIIQFQNGTQTNVSNYSFSLQAKINGTFNQADIANATELCDYVTLHPDIEKMWFESDFTPWLDLASLFAGPSSTGSVVNCSDVYSINWSTTVENLSYGYKYTFQKD